MAKSIYFFIKSKISWYNADTPTRTYTMSRRTGILPKSHCTKSNLNRPTKSQFKPPTITKISVSINNQSHFLPFAFAMQKPPQPTVVHQP